MTDYELKAFIGPLKVLVPWKRQQPWARSVVLHGSLGLVAIVRELEDAIGDPAGWARAHSATSAVALVEADWFGGVGAERASLFRAGSVQPGSVREVLAALGIGDLAPLLRHPTTAAWAAQAIVDEMIAADARQPVRGMVKALQYDGAVEAEVRAIAADRLGRLGRAGRPALPALQAAMRGDTRHRVQLECACALARIGAEGIPKLLGCLDDPTRRERWPIVYALGEAGTDARSAVPALQRLMRDDATAVVRGACAEVLGRLAPDESADALCAALHDPEPHVRRRAAEALGRGVDLYSRHFDALREAGTDADDYVRGAATDAMHRLEQRL